MLSASWGKDVMGLHLCLHVIQKCLVSEPFSKMQGTEIFRFSSAKGIKCKSLWFVKQVKIM